MSLKQQIQTDFTTAFKAKDDVKKMTLSGLKAEITKVEKMAGAADLDDAGVMKVLLSSVKQRKDSITAFRAGGREDLAEKEAGELAVLESYLPKKMDREEAKTRVTVMLESVAGEENKNKKVGTVMGMFNKQFQGLFDNAELKKLIEELVS